MPRTSCWIGLSFLALGILLPVRGADDKKPEKADKGGVKLSGKTMTGKLSRRFPSAEELEDFKKLFADLEADAGDPVEKIQGRMEALKLRMERAFGLQVPAQLLPAELRFIDELEVRVQQAPTQFDAKGKPIKPTPKLLKDLKGPDPKKPGYSSAFENLREGQVVMVYFVANDKPKAAPAKAKAKNADPKAPNVFQAPEPLPKVGMVLILQEAPPK